MGRHIGAEAGNRLRYYGENELADELEGYVYELHRVIATSDNKTLTYQMLAEQKRLKDLEYENSWLRTTLRTISKSQGTGSELAYKARVALKFLSDEKP